MPPKDSNQAPAPSAPASSFFRSFEEFLFKLLRFILESIIAIITSIAKLVRAIGIAVGIIFSAAVLLLITLFYVVDLPSAENFQSSKEKSLDILTNWFEVEFQNEESKEEFVEEVNIAEPISEPEQQLPESEGADSGSEQNTTN